MPSGFDSAVEGNARALAAERFASKLGAWLKLSLRRLRRGALPLDTVELARFLIGRTLVHDIGGVRLAGRIVETEAYLPGDAASHAFRGATRRNGSMFLKRGHAYVYISYGVWPMLNVSSEEEGVGAAVLMRALEPLAGVRSDAARPGRRPRCRYRPRAGTAGARNGDHACA